MAKIELRHLDIDFYDTYIKAIVSGDKKSVLITMNNPDEGNRNICLDKSTAIKFAKTLRTEINKIKE